MLIRLKTVWCDGIPTDKDLEEAITLVHDWNSYIELRWYVRFNGNHSVIVTDEDTVKSLRERIPKRYGV